MKHFATTEFWDCFNKLPKFTQNVARNNFKFLKDDERHPSLHYKKVKQFRSVRAGIHYRALGIESGNDIIWFWIGSHADYDKIIS